MITLFLYILDVCSSVLTWPNHNSSLIPTYTYANKTKQNNQNHNLFPITITQLNPLSAIYIYRHGRLTIALGQNAQNGAVEVREVGVIGVIGVIGQGRRQGRDRGGGEAKDQKGVGNK